MWRNELRQLCKLDDVRDLLAVYLDGRGQEHVAVVIAWSERPADPMLLLQDLQTAEQCRRYSSEVTLYRPK